MCSGNKQIIQRQYLSSTGLGQPQAPTSVSAVAVASDAIQVSWVPALSTQTVEQLRGFRVRFHSASQLFFNSVCTSLSSSFTILSLLIKHLLLRKAYRNSKITLQSSLLLTTSYQLTGLESNGTYSIYVQAFNIYGGSVPSAMVTVHLFKGFEFHFASIHMLCS